MAKNKAIGAHLDPWLVDIFQKYCRDHNQPKKHAMLSALKLYLLLDIADQDFLNRQSLNSEVQKRIEAKIKENDKETLKIPKPRKLFSESGS